jgi:beta-glucosidase
VLLRNNKSLLPLKPETKVYFEAYYNNRQNEGNPHNVIIPEENRWDIGFTDSPSKADFIILWLTPSGGMSGRQRSETASPIDISLSKNSIDIAYVNRLTALKPAAVVINFSKPWAINEIDNKNANTILAAFGTTSSALLDVITGKFNPTGKMPFATPVSQKAAENNMADVPGEMEMEGYSLFKFGDGLSY